MKWFTGLLIAAIATSASADDFLSREAETAIAFAVAEELDGGKENIAGEECPDCYGTGKRGDGRTVLKCPSCDGTGKRKPKGDTIPTTDVRETRDSPDPAESFYGVRFTADWCLPCKQFERTEESRCSMTFGKIDAGTPEGKAASTQFAVSSLPTIIFARRGLNLEVDRIVGFATAEQVNAKVAGLPAEWKRQSDAREQATRLSMARIISKNGEASSATSGAIVRSTPGRVQVLTTKHGFERGSMTVVQFPEQLGDRSFPVERIDQDENADLALITVNVPGRLAIMTSGGSELPGEMNAPRMLKAISWGYPEGAALEIQETTITTVLEVDGVAHCVSSSRPIDGMSGGPLTVDGVLIGVLSFREMDSGEGGSVGFAAISKFLGTVK